MNASSAPAASESVQPSYWRILSAALRLFATKGFHGTGIRDIASAAAVNSSVLYHYAGSKHELLVRLMEDGLRRHYECSVRALEGLDRPEERLVALVETHVFVHAHNQQMAKILDGELIALEEDARRSIVAQRDQIDELWARVIDAGARANVFRVSQPALTRLAIIRMCTAVAHWYSPQGPLPIHVIATTFADLALAMVRASRNGKEVQVEDLQQPVAASPLALVEEAHLTLPR